MAKSHSEAKVQASSHTSLVNIPRELPACDVPVLSREQREIANVIDFLIGVKDGVWRTSVSSCFGATLPTSQDVVTDKVLERIRDRLISLGWAEWMVGNGRHIGWKLRFSAQNILEKFGVQ